MPYNGEVTVFAYGGTLYDDENVPWSVQQIIDDATLKSEKKSQLVWQSRYLQYVDLTIEDYKAAQGYQYFMIQDLNNDPKENNWYQILNYTMINNKLCRFYIKFDPLLTYGINNITKINGNLLRWTVTKDYPFNYVKSIEPLDQVDDFDYSYYRYNCVNGNTPDLPGTSIVGFPYNMDEAPEIITYTNANGTNTNIYYPDLKPTANPTVFINSIGGNKYFTDQLKYYTWPDSKVKQNLAYAIGLGFDLTSNAYTLPDSDLIEIKYNDNSDHSQGINSITGKTKIAFCPLQLYDTTTQLNNQKARDMGNIFTLYNEMSGDSVTVDACDLTTHIIEIYCNPFINGYFAARFKGYLHDVKSDEETTENYTGLVKSIGYQPFNLAINMVSGASLAQFNTNMAIDSLMYDMRISARDIQYNANTAQKTRDLQIEALKNSNIANGVGMGMSLGGSIMSMAAGPAGGLAMGGSAISQLSAVPGMVASSINTEAQANLAYETAMRGALVAMADQADRRMQRMRELMAKGNLGQIGAPPIKYSNDMNIAFNAYTFCVRKCSLSPYDRQRADRFFQAYGYNVDGEYISDPSMLNVRERFTFIQAKDINVEWNNARTRSLQDVQEIQDRFKAGLRIWQETPDFDFTKSNPIKSVKIESRSVKLND